MNLTIDDFKHYPVIVAPREFKLRSIPEDQRIGDEYWIYDRRETFSTTGLGLEVSYFVTKIKILFITKPKIDSSFRRHRIDCYKFIHSNWTRHGYAYDSIYGFCSDNPDSIRIFKNLSDCRSFALQQKLKGFNVVDLAESEYLIDGPSQKKPVQKPITYVSNNTRKPFYIGELIANQGLSRGALVGPLSHNFVTELCSVLPNVNFVMAESFKAGSNLLNLPKNRGSINIHALRRAQISLNEYSAIKPHLQIIEEDHIRAADQVEGQFDFIIFANNCMSTKEFEKSVAAWMPKLTKKAWIFGSGIQNSSVNEIVSQLFPNWVLGYNGVWIQAPAE